MRVQSRRIALTAVMAALYTILSFMPGFPVLGVEGAKIGLVSCIVPIFGFLLGPSLGASAAFFGGVATRVLSGATIYSWLLLPAMTIYAFTAGCLSKRRIGPFRGWIVAALVLAGLISAWYTTQIGQMVLVFPLLHLIALVVIVIFRGQLALFIQHGKEVELTICIALSSFSATMTAQMYGTLAFIAAAEIGAIRVPLHPAFFMGLIPVAAVERLIITFIATVLGVPVLLALRGQLHSP